MFDAARTRPGAIQLQENAFFQTMMENMRTRIYKEWAQASDPIAREDLHAELRALKKLETFIRATIAEEVKNEQPK